MKKWMAGLAAVILCLMGSFWVAKPVAAEDVPADISMNRAKTKLFLEFDSNPTTGYAWTYQMSEKGVVKCIKDLYEQEEAAEGEEPMAGAGGTHYFIFRAKKAGTVVLTFRYARQWEKTDYDKVVKIRIKVRKNGTIRYDRKI